MRHNAFAWLALLLLSALSACTTDASTGALRPGDENRDGGASGGGAAGGGTDAPPDGGLRIVCPDKAPFDTAIPGVAEQCTQRVLIAGLGRGNAKVSRDDGVTWSDVMIVPGPDDVPVFGFASGYGIVAAMTQRGVYTSRDAATWTAVPATEAYHYAAAIAFDDGRFVSAGSGGTFGSDDGVAWNGYKSGEVYPSGAKAGVHTRGVVFFGGAWYLAGDAGDAQGSAVIRRSTDGRGWAEQTITPGTLGTYASIAAIKGHAVVVGGCCDQPSDGVLGHSTDGTSWTNQVDKALQIRFVVSDGARFVAFTPTAQLTSPDGVTWTKAGAGAPLEGAIFADGMWLGRQGSEVFASPDGLTWTSKLMIPPGQGVGSLGVARLLKKR